MLTHVELFSLSHLLRAERVLSVYVDGAVHDPAQQRAWRVELDNMLKAIRRSIEAAPHGERTAFEECVALLEGRLAWLGAGGNVGAPGWAAFITRQGVHHAEPLHVPTPTLAVWETGIHLTPYVRALKQSRPVAVVVADARKARIYRYGAGALAHVETMHARAVTEPPSHMGNPPAPGFHGGTRGATGEASEQRALMAGTERMVASAAEKALALAGPEGWIVAGGIARVAAQLTREMERTARGRVLHRESLDVHATDAEVAAAAQASASALRDANDLRSVVDIIATAERTGPAAVGPEATRYALEQSCVRELYITERYARADVAGAEEAVRAAIAQGAVVEEVTRDVAARLDAYGGIGARLRYALTKPGASVSTERGAESAEAAR